MIKPRSVGPYPSDCAKESFANSILDERKFLTEPLRLDLGFLREKSYPAKSSCFSRLAGLFAEEPFTDSLFY
jgi:hypothetical protein